MLVAGCFLLVLTEFQLFWWLMGRWTSMGSLWDVVYDQQAVI